MNKCSSMICDESKFITVDGCISEYDEYSEIQCLLCNKIWDELSSIEFYGLESNERIFR